MQNFALGGFSAEQFWQCISAPVEYATSSLFITLRRIETIVRALPPRRRVRVGGSLAGWEINQEFGDESG
jgi:hypothetical protein